MTTLRRTVRLLLPAFGVAVVIALGVAIWSSTPRSRSPLAPTRTPAPAASTGVDRARLTVVHASSAGYDATFHITRTRLGARTLTLLDVRLSTEATPASAPNAHAQLTGSDGIRRDVALTVVGAGRWTSKAFSLAAGRYTLSAQFDRLGGSVTVRTAVRLS